MNALQRHFVATNLTVGTLYQFKVSAINFNGPSALSNALSVHACVLPGPASAPERIAGDRTSISLAWQAPTDDGGCGVEGYQLMRDQGLGLNDPITVEVAAADINGRPTLTEHQVVLTASETGKPIRFQLITHNAEGSSESAIIQHIIAAPPSKPAGLVTSRYAETPYLTLQ